MNPNYDKLNKNADLVRDILRIAGIRNNFFIAGGSVFSLINNNSNYNDLDVYFYEEIDFSALENIKLTFSASVSVSKAAVTITVGDYPQTIIQFLKISQGTPEEVFETFDINHSKVAYTSDYKLIISENFSKEIDINFKLFSTKTYFRYKKYLNKGSKDPDNRTLNKIIDFLVDDLFGFVRLFTYGEEDSQQNHTNRKTKLCVLKTLDKKHFNHNLYNKIVQKYSELECLEIFKTLIYNFKENLFFTSESDEFLLQFFLVSKKFTLTATQYQRLAEKYPEYLI